MIKNKRENFRSEIEKIVSKGDMSYMDAILHYCEQNALDPTYITSLIPKDIKLKVEAEAQSLNFIPGPPQLPLD